MVRVIIESGLVNALMELNENAPRIICLEGIMNDREVHLRDIADEETRINCYQPTRHNEEVPYYTPLLHTDTIKSGYVTIQLSDEMFSKPINLDSLRYGKKCSVSIHAYEESG